MPGLSTRGAVACLLFASAVVRAEPEGEPNPEAEKLFRDARAALKDGNTAAACDMFAASSKLGPSVGTFLNLGDCRAKRGELATAWAAFVEAGRLAGKTGDPRKAEADKRASELEPQLSYLTLEVPARVPGLVVTRDDVGIDAAAWNQPIAVDPGAHTVVAIAPGYDSWSTKVDVAPTADHAIARVPPLHAHPAATTPMTIRSSTPVLTTTRVVGIASAGAAVLAGAVSVGLMIDAKTLETAAKTKCSSSPCHDPQASATSDKAVARANLATYTSIAGGVLAAAGVALWFVGRPHESAPPPLTASATSDSLTVSLIGRF